MDKHVEILDNALQKIALAIDYRLKPVFYGNPSVTELMQLNSRILEKIANAISPNDSVNNVDSFGKHVGSLTEAVMGVTLGLREIAESIKLLAESIENRD